MHPALLGISTACLWGVHDLIAGITSRRFGYLPTVLGSTFFGLVALSVWILLTGSFPDPLQAGAWIAYGSGMGFALATMCLFAALASGPMSLGVPVAGSYPVTSLILAAAFGTLPTPLQLILALTVIVGVVMVSVAGGGTSDRTGFAPGWFRRTLLFALASHVLFALAIWAGQAAAVHLGTLQTTWLARLSGLMLLAVIFAAGRQTLRGKGSCVPVVALLGLLDVLAISGMNHAGVTSHPEVATVIGSTFGPVTVVLAWLFLGERIPPLRWLGIAVTFSGVAALYGAA